VFICSKINISLVSHTTNNNNNSQVND